MIRWSVFILGTLAIAPVLQGQAMYVSHAEPLQTAPATPLRVSVTFSATPLEAAVRTVAEQAGIVLTYDSAKLPKILVTYTSSNTPLEQVFREILANTNLRVERGTGNRFVIVPARKAQGTIVGRVVHAGTKQPVVGATVMLDDASKGVTTGNDGTFRLAASVGEHTIHIRGVGFVKVSQRVTVSGDEAVSVEIVLEPSASVLDGVVVTGTVVATERKAIPNPITVITADEIEKRGITKVEQLLRGEVPGVMALEQGSEAYGVSQDVNSLGAGATAVVYARGSSGFGSIGSGVPNPLKTYVDGVEILDPSYIGTIDPQSIARIEIVTGPQAATIYGSGAMGGVMQIFTKTGLGRTTPEFTLRLRSGTLENNMTHGRAATHNDALAITGGNGPGFSYSGNVSYDYSGQWQPGLYTRKYGGSVGAVHARDRLTVDGSASTTGSRNGLVGSDFLAGVTSPLVREFVASGKWRQAGVAGFNIKRTSRTAAQTVALNLRYRVSSLWQHHLTLGRNQTQFVLDPQAPTLGSPWDTLFRTSESQGARTTASYNTTLIMPPMRFMSATMTMGGNGSSGGQTRVLGCLPTKETTAMVGCSEWETTQISRPLNEQSWGGFGNWQWGFFDRLYVTLGLRAERNPTYGQKHRIDWTPTNGVAYTHEIRDLTIKVLGSYGRATRAPAPDRRREQWSLTPGAEAVPYLSQIANPYLTPEYSRGPQVGAELYYGNHFSLTVNRYNQKISDYIQLVAVDSAPFRSAADPNEILYTPVHQYQNVASIRQHGWETTTSLTWRALNVKGVYSWTDSRVLANSARTPQSFWYHPGRSFSGVLTHTGNITLGYVAGGTSISLVNNFVGKSLTSTSWPPFNRFEAYKRTQARLPMYTDFSLGRMQRLTDNGVMEKPGYAKTDLAGSRRLSKSISVILNIVNLGNNYSSDMEMMGMAPSLGRQTSVGITYRWAH